MAGQAVPVQQNADGPIGPTAARHDAFVVSRGDGMHELALMIDGLRCAGCIGKIESAMARHAAVKSARVNFSTGKLNLVWTGPRDMAGTLIRDIDALGFHASAYDPAALDMTHDRERRFLLLCLGVAGFAAGNIMLLSFALWLTGIEDMGAGTRSFLHLISALIAIPAIAFSGRPFFRSALAALSKRRTNMDVPISLALILATGISLYQLFTHAEHAYFDSAVMLMFFLLIGRYLDFQARSRARSAAADLAALMAATATVIDDSGHRIIPATALAPGMTIAVAAGERIPADGVVIDGRSEIDSGLITGESLPAAAVPGDTVLSGMLNLAAPLRVRVEKAAENSFLADIVRLMERAEQAQSGYTRLADRVAARYTPVVHTLAALTFAGWFFIGAMPLDQSLLVAVTVLIITCPCALGLAVPVVQVLAVGGLMRRGIMVKSGDALERLAAIDTLYVDKTGTLTLGRPVAMNIAAIPPATLRIAAALAASSRHPLSQSLATHLSGPVPDLRDITENPGFGLAATHDGREIRLGSRIWCSAGHDTPDDSFMELWFRDGDAAPVRILFDDALRPDAADAIRAFRDGGITRIALLSGDRPAITARIAAALDIADYAGGMTPGKKYDRLEHDRAAGRRVLMVGDGINDAPTLTGAHVSVSPASAADITRNAADIVFTGDSLKSLPLAWDVARYAQKLIRQNFILAAAYNLIAVPLAMAGLVTPLIAAIAMSSSSLVVILNAFRLRGRV